MIAAANLTQQRCSPSRRYIRGFLIRGNADAAAGLPGSARRLPAAALELADARRADDPGQARRAETIRAEALAYVDDYADPVIARTREGGRQRGARVRVRRRRQRAGGRRSTAWIAALDAARADAAPMRESRAADSGLATARCWIAGVGLALCFLVLGGGHVPTSRGGS